MSRRRYTPAPRGEDAYPIRLCAFEGVLLQVLLRYPAGKRHLRRTERLKAAAHELPAFCKRQMPDTMKQARSAKKIGVRGLCRLHAL
jgi:hypothetical protein